MRFSNCLIALVLLTSPAAASEYAGQEKRALKSLSAEDIDELRNGRGWGLAKPAELNGLPGPVHLLEHKEQLELSEFQIEKIESLYQEMRQEARSLGAKYIEQERAVEALLLKPNTTRESLSSAVNAAAQTLADLRLTHLAAHLQTPQLLSRRQLNRYNQLRGYSNGDPCDNPPAGHDLNMWKRHNNCL